MTAVEDRVRDHEFGRGGRVGDQLLEGPNQDGREVCGLTPLGPLGKRLPSQTTEHPFGDQCFTPD